MRSTPGTGRYFPLKSLCPDASIDGAKHEVMRSVQSQWLHHVANVGLDRQGRFQAFSSEMVFLKRGFITMVGQFPHQFKMRFSSNPLEFARSKTLVGACDIENTSAFTSPELSASRTIARRRSGKD